ncbi:beta-lactamase class A [Acetobacter indonesiensis NRIC 0313]|uniref:Beta-lactamase n=1 Tax=Acetobacter indonesiensis TaxID=104101 RepID=A0A6N3T3E1_9PROT|nr:class A beta-lactamase [Acetobacter indonesiensis]GAN62161.1 beta-lactamase [Acetobacter indonesiensis]GBQ60713.1 beta-lactamase class A [Acetobacter indonesiensis NRIC 0313]GEN02129.1 beta-lactamase [Acetobacter indonesiensis]
MKRRHFLGASALFVTSPSLAQTQPPKALADYESRTGGHIGFFAQNVVTGASLGWRASERFVMCSTFKASLAACVLSRIDQGHDTLETTLPFSAADIKDFYAPVAKANLARGILTLRDLCAGAVEQSDNVCANLLLTHIGGPSALTAFWHALGDTTTRLDAYEPELNRTPLDRLENTTTPTAMTSVLKAIALGPALSALSRALLVQWMIACQTGTHRLRAGLPKHWVVGDKTGNNGKDAAGDIAVIWAKSDTPLLVSAYTRGGKPTETDFATAFAAIGSLVAARLAGI